MRVTHRAHDLDVEVAYEAMVRMRRFEEAQAEMWRDGLISGEMHLGVGEEGVVAGVVGNLVDGDAMALDHRSTPPLVARGADLESLFLEVLGSEKGLCRGRGGHMHLLAPDLLAASDGIVGAGAPLACGFAFAAQRLRPGHVAVAFFGEGAANQGMLLEAFNLAVVWNLPVLFVCKDNGWSITTRSTEVTGGGLVRRARAFGVRARAVDGGRVDAVAKESARLIDRARRGNGPGFLLTRCHRPQGHFLGDPMLRMMTEPLDQARQLGPPLLRAAVAGDGARPTVRLAGLSGIGGRIARLTLQYTLHRRDPLARARALLDADTAAAIEERVSAEVRAAADNALSQAGLPGVGAGR
ncbi:thiamine pyrophosphate-dependent dehydrogenase E1 component subunit alpha [Mycobacterium sp. Y57]|uniref:thiamine pyrophosphate-dependent dehydrogenase E1 component subunit alpha n=1 Tax=Mycolicibacterium xanthum TaxID=2796469 RepID=UPI001C84BB77|nr:thiamine pyrophosphate-dependent dehydrogenase E1 component subunit alpha [Mycolicibacterium xanthum]MBX7431079.1 thiamine pyrophosphate-dependent dehydrogenase E1 component subunit alpha [Mycolicibacterium xanthum]